MNKVSDLDKLFESGELYTQALTHKSWVNEHAGKQGSNERLEFLGDAVLEFVVSKALYQKFPLEEEGYLTALRANLVNTQNLSELAKKLEVGKRLLLSKGEEDGGGRENPSLLADTIEAIIGALFLDRGISEVEKFIDSNILQEIPEKVEGPLKDAKSRLQEAVQSKGLPAPRYKVIEASGPDHNKSFVIAVEVGGNIVGRGEGKSKSQAEQEAAKEGLAKI